MILRSIFAAAALILLSTGAEAKDDANQAAPAKKAPELPARKLFGSVKVAAPLAARAIGFYSRGCLAGAKRLEPTGSAWQAMRLSRNRNWGHPALITLVQRLAVDAKAKDGWNGLLVGDIAQPRGGPMLSGHASHQVGLDADIWLREMPERLLPIKEREKFQPISMLASQLAVDPAKFTPKHLALIKRAASYPEVERIGVNYAIKHALCKMATGDKSWLSKVRPWPGHHYHMHIRMSCPAGSAGCKGQTPPGSDDGCAYMEKWYERTKAWLERPKSKRKPSKTVKKKPRKKREIMMAGLPDACAVVLKAPVTNGPAASPADDAVAKLIEKTK